MDSPIWALRDRLTSSQVFGNSNSLPISLVLSLSQTIKGLHWDRVAGDNDDEVAARGILYLLIFQQLGQLVRWSWGYNVLLAPPETYNGTTENVNSRLENGEAGSDEDRQRLLDYSADEDGDEQNMSGSEETRVEGGVAGKGSTSRSQVEHDFSSGEQTPITNRQKTSVFSRRSSDANLVKAGPAPDLLSDSANGNIESSRRVIPFPSIWSATDPDGEEIPQGPKGLPLRCKIRAKKMLRSISKSTTDASSTLFHALPPLLQRCLAKSYAGLKWFLLSLWSFMNPPLWAMLAAIVVASIPDLQRFFFAEGTFFKNSVTSAISQSGGVAVPLILVVLGANLARNTLPNEHHTKEDDKEETKLLIAALISRMLLPTLIMAPILAVTAKYVPVSILDDPIFVIVCFLITGAPSALQLAQICQINNVYMGAMSRLLFQSYVVWILPSTLILVMCALEVVEWAQQ